MNTNNNVFVDVIKIVVAGVVITLGFTYFPALTMALLVIGTVLFMIVSISTAYIGVSCASALSNIF